MRYKENTIRQIFTSGLLTCDASFNMNCEVELTVNRSIIMDPLSVKLSLWFSLPKIGEVEHLPLRSDTVEQNYLMSGNTPLNFGHFKLDFRRMRLEDLHTGRKFKVRRRPQFQLRHNRAELEDR